MRVATFNAHDSAAAVRRSLDLAGLILWQEYPRGLAPESFGLAVGDGNVVTGWRLRWWTSRGSTWVKAHDGRERVTPRRGTLVTRLEHRRTGLEVAVLNGHRINRTRGPWLAVPGVHARWRARRWDEHAELDEWIVDQLLDDGVQLIIGGGDYNRRHVTLPHPRAFYLAGPTNIDKLWAVDAADRFDLERGPADAVRRLGSDHPLRRARFRIRRA